MTICVRSGMELCLVLLYEMFVFVCFECFASAVPTERIGWWLVLGG